MSRQEQYQHACQPNLNNELMSVDTSAHTALHAKNAWIMIKLLNDTNTKSHSKGWWLWPRQQRYDDTCLPQSPHFNINLHVEPYSSTLLGKAVTKHQNDNTIWTWTGQATKQHVLAYHPATVQCAVVLCYQYPSMCKARHVQQLPNNQWSKTL